MSLPTQQLMHELFDYHDGNLYWKVKSSTKVSIGDKAGSVTAKGYCQISIKGWLYLAHRLIYLMHRGNLPWCIDHIDGDPSNNRIENLRAATLTENMANRPINSNNTSGFKNVYKSKNGKKWIVVLKLKDKQKYFGTYDDIELASLVATEARAKYHKEFARDE